MVSQTTVEVPATETQAAPEQPPPSSQAIGGSGDTSGAALNDQGYRLLRNGSVDAALPYFERAVHLLRGSNTIAEAYASYNLALARFSLGRCDGVIELLDRSEEVQGKRPEIKRLRRDAERACGDG